MPTLYCPDNGHRVTYSDARPKTCPVCHGSLEPKSVAALAAAIAPSRPVQHQPSHPVQRATPEYSEDGELSFVADSIRAQTSQARMTVEELAKSAAPVRREREERSAERAAGVSVASLVDAMLADEPAAPKRRPRRGRARGGAA